MPSRSRLFSKVATDVDASGNLKAEAIASDVPFGATVYQSTDNLPYVGNSTGDQAYVKDNNRFYIWDSAGWYNVALINRAPAISSVQDSDGNTTPFTLAIDGTATTITITAADSDGDPITYSATADSDFNGLATVSDSDNVFTITPFSQDSASTTSGTITFKATDGVNIASSGVQTFTLSFVSAFWDEVVLSIGMADSDGLDNSTFIDRSTNAHTVTPTGSPTQTAFHPYLDNWSYRNPENTALNVATSADFELGTDDWTIEFWVYPEVWSGAASIFLDFRTSGTQPVPVIQSSDGSNLTLYVNGSNLITGTAPPLNEWAHIACTREGNTHRLFVNGQQTGSDYVGAQTYIQGSPTIGSYGPAPSTYDIIGNYSNVRIVKGTALYTANFTPPTEKLTAVSGTVLLACQSNRFIDNSPSAHAITLSGAPEISAFNPFGQESEYAVGENKGATYFGGSGNYLDFGQQSEYVVGTNDFDISFWVYPDYPLNASANPIIKMYSAEGVTLEVRLVNDNVSFQFGSSGSGDRTILNGSEDLRAYQWNYIRVGRDASNLYIFVNGVLDTSTSSTQNVTDTTYVFYMNSDQTGSSGQEQYISDFYFSNGNGCGTSSFTPPTAPVGNTNASLYLPMDNAGIYDKTGNNTLTLYGNTATSTTQTKFADTAIYFDGTGDYIRSDESLSMITSTSSLWTIEGWGYALTLGETGGSSDDIIGINRLSDGYNVVTYGPKISRYRGAEAAVTDWNLNEWTHFAITYDGTTYRIFLNGTLDYSTAAAPTNALSECSLLIGAEADTADGGSVGNYFNGYLENLQILNGVAKYTSNFTVPSQEQGRIYQAED